MKAPISTSEGGQLEHDPANVDNLQQQQDYGDEDADDQQDPGEMGMYGSVSNALAGQRASKKRAEDDVKLLANRLALLKLEEKKVSPFSFDLTLSIVVLSGCWATMPSV